MLQTVELCKSFGATQALDRVSLNVQPGEIYCLLGANGAGKTTLINVFLNFLEPTSGQALVGGKVVAQEAAETKRLLAYIPEQVMLYGALSGIENLKYFSALAIGKETSKERLVSLLIEAGLDEAATQRRVSTYSKGMRQKVGIAIALAKGAKALLLDEPTSGLDPKASAEFSQLLRNARDAGVAILATTHDLFHAKQTGSRIGIMKQGKLVEEVKASDLSHTDLESLYLAHMR
ncbi:MAG: ABC transporter ATP-binding protein [Casimicrobium sp.]